MLQYHPHTNAYATKVVLPPITGKFSTMPLSIIHALIPGYLWMATFDLDMDQGAVNMAGSSQCTILRYSGIRGLPAKAHYPCPPLSTSLTPVALAGPRGA
jgi:hypothetical protein